jgi:tyrosyl-tRNA synthetase
MNEGLHPDLETHLRVIRRGAVEIIQEAELRERIARSIGEGRPLRVKAGFDPTAPDLHLGHTVLIQKLKHFQDLGHQIIFLIGDFTGLIGDPSGRSETRKPLSEQEIAANARTYESQIFKILDRDRTEIAFNSAWMNKMNSAEMIELAANYTVARLLERDDFHTRYSEGEPIHLHEFLYPLIQGYDSVALRASVELGGTDQKFNLLVGREIQRAHDQEPQVVLTMPLLEGLDGKEKMSKSLGNTVGITEPPEEIFGKLMSISDELMLRYYELLSDRTVEELEGLRAALSGGELHPMKAKEDLAAEMVARFHGAVAAEAAREHFARVHQQRQVPDAIERVVLEAPAEGKIWLPRLLKTLGLATGQGAARRLIAQGGVRVNGIRITDPKAEIPASGEVILQVGKRHFRKVSFRRP